MSYTSYTSSNCKLSGFRGLSAVASILTFFMAFHDADGMNNNNFTLALSVADINGNSIEGLNKYYTLQIPKIRKHNYSKEVRLQKYQVSLIYHMRLAINYIMYFSYMTHFLTDLQQNYFKRIKLSSLQCINRKFLNDSPPILKGQINSMEFQYILIHLKICKNTTESQTCSSNEEIFAKLGSAQYNIYSSDYLLSLARAKELLEQIITPYFVSFSTSTSKKILQYYEIVQITSDDGLLFEQLQHRLISKRDNLSLIQNYIMENTQFRIILPYNQYKQITLDLILNQKLFQRKLEEFADFFTCFFFLVQTFIILFNAFVAINFIYILSQMYVNETNSQIQVEEKMKGVLIPLNMLLIDFLIPSFHQLKQSQDVIIRKVNSLKLLSGNYIVFSYCKHFEKLQRVELFIKIITSQRQFQALMALSKSHIIYSDKGILIAKHSDNDKKQNRLQYKYYQTLRKQNYTHVTVLLKDLKKSQTFGLENEINQKLISEIEKHSKFQSSD